MSQISKPLPTPLASGIVYDAVLIENPLYDMAAMQWQARVYGIFRGVVMPLIVSTPVAVHRIEDVTITDAEIDAVLSEHPELNGNRVEGAIAGAFARLYALAAETETPPDAP